MKIYVKYYKRHMTVFTHVFGIVRNVALSRSPKKRFQQFSNFRPSSLD